MTATILLCAALLAAAGLIVRGMVKNRRQGKSPCGCDCGSCGACGQCGNNK